MAPRDSSAGQTKDLSEVVSIDEAKISLTGTSEFGPLRGAETVTGERALHGTGVEVAF